MIAVNVQNVYLSILNILELVDVVGCLSEVVTVLLDLYEGVNEVLHFDLNFVGVDVCSPQNLSVARCFSNVILSLQGGCHSVWLTLIILVTMQYSYKLRWLVAGVENRSTKQSVHIEEASLLVELRNLMRCVQNTKPIKIKYKLTIVRVLGS